MPSVISQSSRVSPKEAFLPVGSGCCAPIPSEKDTSGFFRVSSTRNLLVASVRLPNFTVLVTQRSQKKRHEGFPQKGSTNRHLLFSNFGSLVYCLFLMVYRSIMEVVSFVFRGWIQCSEKSLVSDVEKASPPESCTTLVGNS